MLISKLECINQTESFIDTSSDWQIVDGNLANLEFSVHQEESTQINTFLLNQDTVVLGDGVRRICHKRIVNSTQSTLLTGLIQPGPMAVFGISGDTNDFSVASLEFLDTVRECNNLSGADKGEILGIEENNNVLS